MEDIKNLMWKRFKEITKIPRASKKEDKIREYLKNVGKSLNLKVETDEAGNVLMKKNASIGRENEKGLILQAHMDMVCEKLTTSKHNFDTDPIDLIECDDFIKANGTTLGADDGIGIAMILSIMESKEISHPQIEGLFTVDEETGLYGASNLKKDWINGKTLINLDSEEEGEFCIGCAGGTDTLSTITFKREKAKNNLFFFKITISGLKGGHSGSDIDKNRANAIKLMTEYINTLNQKTDLRIAEIKGGNLRNAIPREAEALIAIPFKDKEKARIEMNIFISEKEGLYGKTEKNMNINLESTDYYPTLLPKKISNEVIEALKKCPHGIIKMSEKIKDLVETSTNLAAISTKDDYILIETSQRSSFENEKIKISETVSKALTTSSSTISRGKDYPGWEPNLNSPILKKCVERYQKLFNKKPIIKVIHAGLECGVFIQKYKDWDMVSFGPNLENVHTPEEKVYISSANRTINLLIEIIK